MTYSQNNRIYTYLKQGHSLTPLVALKMFGCFRLAARVYDLRYIGVNVKQRLIRIRGKRVSVYWIAT
jgi:hypothetical protein